MKWVVRILVALVVIVVLIIGVGLLLPTDYTVQRLIVINASPEQIHQLVGDLKAWEQWAPWEEEDPTIVTTFGDSTSGVGAHQEWSGESGSGHLTFTMSDTATGVEYDMAFLQDEQEFPATGFMHYRPMEAGTEVTWGMHGNMDVPVIGGYFALMSDSLIGPMFDKGLQNLKKKAEGSTSALNLSPAAAITW